MLLGFLNAHRVPDHHWSALHFAATHAWSSDVYLGVSGLAGCLSVIGPSDPARARPIAEVIRRRSERHLEDVLARHQAGRSVMIGFAHGVMGSLLAFEQCVALLGETEHVSSRRVRARVLRFVLNLAQDEGGRPTWRAGSRPRLGAEPTNGVCHGATGLGFAALYGYRYSGDDVYEALLNASLAGVPMVGADASFCCGLLGRVNVLLDCHRLTDSPEALLAAQQHFALVRPEAFSSEGWGYGRGGYRLTAWRLADATAELPGYPLTIEPLSRR